MLGKITKIDTLKSSRNQGQAFQRVYFKLKRGQGDYIWSKTDIVPSFRNYAGWKPYLEVGNILDGLMLKSDNTVDADSRPVFIRKAEPETKFEQQDMENAEKESVQGSLFTN